MSRYLDRTFCHFVMLKIFCLLVNTMLLTANSKLTFCKFKKPVVILLFGCPGVGKSTLKNEVMSEFYEFYCVSRDDLRFSILNYQSTKRDYQEHIEDLIRKLENTELEYFAKRKLNIIVDDAFLDYRFFFESELFKDYHILLVDFLLEVPIELAKKRNVLRERSVPDFVYNKFSVYYKEYFSYMYKNNFFHYVVVPSEVMTKLYQLLY